MKLENIYIGKQILNDGTEIYVPYTKDITGDIIPYEPFNTIKEVLLWVLDQNPPMSLETLNDIAARIQCPQMRSEVLEFIATTGVTES